MNIAGNKFKRNNCCLGGWIYDKRYGWVICANHEVEAAQVGKPSDYFITFFKAWQPLKEV